MRILKIGVVTSTAVLLGTAVAGCGSGAEASQGVAKGGWDKVVAAADQEAQVAFYSVAPDVQNVRIQKAFAAKYPNIKLNITRGAGELPPRVAAEIQSGSDGADVFMYSDPAWFAKNKEHLLDGTGPSVQGWSDSSWAVKDKSPVTYTGPFSLFVWNTKLFPNGFKSWDDFLSPAVKGKLALRSNLTPSVAGYLAFMEDKLGPDYLRKLAGQSPKFYPSTVPMAQAIASGEVGATNINNISNVKDLIATGAPLAYAVPHPSYSIEWAAGALSNSKRPNAAVVFLDFLMSKEGQEALDGDGYGKAGRDIEGDLDLKDTAVLDSTKYTPDVMATWKKKFTDYFGRSAG